MQKVALVVAAGTMMLLWNALPVHAQYFTPYTYGPYSNRIFNNPTASTYDMMLMNNMNAMMLNTFMSSSNSSKAALRAAYQKQVQAGQSRIKSGKATTRFATRSFPMDHWVKQTGGNTPEKRKQLASELVVQKSIWSEEANRRGADTSDMAQMLGLTFVLGWEAYTGQRATSAQYQGITNDFRTMLLKNPLYQGMDTPAKQNYFEFFMVNVTDAVRVLHEAQRTDDPIMMQKARSSGGNYVNSWLPKGYTHYVATASGFQEAK